MHCLPLCVAFEHGIACLDVTLIGRSLWVKTLLLASNRVAYSGPGAAPPASHPFQLLTLPSTPAGAETERSDAAAVGTWGMEALILTLPGLKPLFKETLPTDVIPRRWGGAHRALGCCTACRWCACPLWVDAAARTHSCSAYPFQATSAHPSAPPRLPAAHCLSSLRATPTCSALQPLPLLT